MSMSKWIGRTKTAVKTHQVKFLCYGYFDKLSKWHPATWKTIEVSALDRHQALKIAKSRYRRGEQFEVID